MSPHAPSPGPVLETERLVLRPHGLSDFADSAGMWGDAEVTRHIGGRPFSQEEVWARLLRYAGHWALLDYGFWAVREKDGGRFVGEVGFADFRRDITPSFDGVPEIGWVLSPAVHGRGYATEAVNAALGWAATRWATGRTVCIIAPSNIASLRVAEKCGYRQFAASVYKDAPILLFERTP